MTEDLATWEDAEAIKQRFPASLAWGQAGAQGGGVSAPHMLGAQVQLQGPEGTDATTQERPAQNGHARPAFSRRVVER